MYCLHIMFPQYVSSSWNWPYKKNAFTWCISMCHVIGLKQTCGIQNVTQKNCGCHGLLGKVIYITLFLIMINEYHDFFVLRNVHSQYHIVLKSHDTTQKKCPHVVHLRYQPPFRTVCAQIAVALSFFLYTPTNHTFSESLIVPDYGSFF